MSVGKYQEQGIRNKEQAARYQAQRMLQHCRLLRWI